MLKAYRSFVLAREVKEAISDNTPTQAIRYVHIGEQFQLFHTVPLNLYLLWSCRGRLESELNNLADSLTDFIESNMGIPRYGITITHEVPAL